MPESLPDDALRPAPQTYWDFDSPASNAAAGYCKPFRGSRCPVWWFAPPRFRRLIREAFIFEALEHPLHDRIIIAIPSVDSLIYTGYSYDCVFPGLCNEPGHKPECAFQIELQ